MPNRSQVPRPHFRETDELEAGTGSPAEPEVVDVPQASRYELRLGADA
jgi:hypothetical protein